MRMNYDDIKLLIHLLPFKEETFFAT